MFCIHESYESRKEEVYQNTINNKEEYQKEVYQYGKRLAYEMGLTSVFDIGCGNAYKLLKYFPNLYMVGSEISPTYEWLLINYPTKKWLKSDFKKLPPLDPHLIICADVIEHLLKPDCLLEYIQRIDFKIGIISTPIRSRYGGPPENIYHIREWDFEEFEQYIGSFFHIVNHFIINEQTRTQCIVFSQ